MVVSRIPFKIKSSITPTITTKSPNSPPNAVRAKNWVVSNETETITWTNTGTVPNVTILYSKDDFVADIHTIVTDTANTGSRSWTIPDFGQGGVDIKVRVYDARDVNLATGAGAYGETAEFMVDYYQVTFNMFDEVTVSHLFTMNVDWNYPGHFDNQYYDSPIQHKYPYDSDMRTVLFIKVNYSPMAVSMTVNRDLVITRYMESSLIHQWQVMADINYNEDADILEITAWFMRDGLSLPGSESATVDIYNNSGVLTKTMTSSSPDSTSTFRMNWANPITDLNHTYMAIVTINHGGKSYKSALTYNIDLNNITVSGSSGNPVVITVTGTSGTPVIVMPAESSSSDRRCFIATAAYGTPLARDIDVLREMRDKYLMTNIAGKAFVELYYKYSPPVAKVISKNETLRGIVRAGLKPLVGLARMIIDY